MSKIIDLFPNATEEMDCFVDAELESTCTVAYTPVLRSASPCTSLSFASLKRSLIFFFLIFNIFFSSQVLANRTYPLDSVKKEAQFNHLLKDLRCLVCQNQDLADSNAELAKDLRMQVYQMVKEGKSDHEIIDYLSVRYGDFILFNPPVKAVTLLLWFGPFLFLLIGFIIFWRTCFISHKK